MSAAEKNTAGKPKPESPKPETQSAEINPMVNLNAVAPPNKSLTEAAMNVHWKGYGADATARAGESWEQLCRDLLDKPQPPYANIHEVTGSADFALSPSLMQSSGSLLLRYPPGANFDVNLGKVLSLAGVTVTRGYRLVIPVERRNLPGVGETLVLLLTKRRLEKINSRNKPGQSAQDSSATV